MTVAMRDSGGIKYLLTDHLGSVVAVTSSSGTLISQQRYKPFGEVRELSGSARISETDYGYTGQRALGMGLMDYKARFYDAALGRFTQPDTIVQNTWSPQSWNRFSYVVNNPVSYIDPSGHFAIPMIAIGITLLVVAAVTVIYMNTPQGAQLREQAADGLGRIADTVTDRVLQMGKGKHSGDAPVQGEGIKTYNGQNTTYGPEGGDPGPSWGKWLAKAGPVGVFIGFILAGADYCSNAGLASCFGTGSTLPAAATPQPTATATPTASCIPYNVCPGGNQVPPSATATATSSPTATPVATTPAPPPSIPPIQQPHLSIAT